MENTEDSHRYDNIKSAAFALPANSAVKFLKAKFKIEDEQQKAFTQQAPEEVRINPCT